jgi:hypothetical protein
MTDKFLFRFSRDAGESSCQIEDGSLGAFQFQLANKCAQDFADEACSLSPPKKQPLFPSPPCALPPGRAVWAAAFGWQGYPALREN